MEGGEILVNCVSRAVLLEDMGVQVGEKGMGSHVAFSSGRMSWTQAGEGTGLCDKAIPTGASTRVDVEEANGSDRMERRSPRQWYESVTVRRETR